MALSGKWTELFANNAYELILEWSGSQNISANTTSVTAILKIRGVTSYSTINDATASPTNISINGNNKSFNQTSTVSAGQTRELGRHTVNVGHNADGSKQINISANHFWDINWSGTGHQTPSVGGNVALNTIPRASTGSGSDFVFTGNSSISINRASSSFTHVARIHVDGTFIKEITGLGTSGTFNFTDAERRNIVSKMANRTSVQCRVDLQTRNGSTVIGGWTSFTYNVTAPAKAGGTVADFTISTSGFPVRLNNYNTGAKFSYDATWTFGSFSKKVTGVAQNFTFPLTQSDVDTMLNIIKNNNTGVGSITVQSFFDGVQFGGNTSIGSVTARVDTALYAPDVKAGSTYKDTNAKSVALTGSDQIIIQGVSQISVTIPANLGTSHGGATLSKIRIALGGATKEIDYTATATTIALGTTNANSNGNLTVTVIDSRGNSGLWSTPVTILGYSKPQISPVIARVNNYETTTEIALSGTYSRVIVSGVEKNTIVSARVRYKQNPRSDIWSADLDLSFNASSGNISSPPNTTITLDNTYSWIVQVEVKDKLDSVTTYETFVAEGIPLLFLDTKLKSVGIGMFPNTERALQLAMGYDLYATQVFASNVQTTRLESQTVKALGGYVPIDIPANDNLNNYTSAGFYKCGYTDTAKTIANTPVNYAFSLLVEQHAGCKQTFTTYFAGNPNTYVRNFYNGGWGEWQLGGEPVWLHTGVGMGYGTTANLSRAGRMVTIYVGRQTRNWSATNENTALSETIPAGYRPAQEATFVLTRNVAKSYTQPVRIHIAPSGKMAYTNTQATNAIVTGTLSYITNDPYP